MLPDVPQRAARHHRQHRRRRCRPAGPGRALRRRRPVSRRRRRQGHGDVLRHRQRDLRRVRLLARRRVRLRGLAGLRPQGDGDHRAGRVGIGQASLPRARHRHPGGGLHGRRDRRHVGRRVRQRHAALAAHQAARRVQPRPHLPRPRPRRRAELRGAPATVRAPALVVERLRPRRSSPRAAASGPARRNRSRSPTSSGRRSRSMPRSSRRSS